MSGATSWPGGKGGPPVLVGGSSAGTESDGLKSGRNAFASSHIKPSAGPAARRHGRVARATQEL